MATGPMSGDATSPATAPTAPPTATALEAAVEPRNDCQQNPYRSDTLTTRRLPALPSVIDRDRDWQRPPDTAALCPSSHRSSGSELADRRRRGSRTFRAHSDEG